MVRFGEKGTLRLVFEIDTPGAHGAYTHISKNAIKVASDLIQDLYRLEDLPVVPAGGHQAGDRRVGAGHRERARARAAAPSSIASRCRSA